MPEFGKDISWVTPVIIAVISDLLQGWKLMLRLFQATWPQVPGASFSPVTKSNIEM